MAGRLSPRPLSVTASNRPSFAMRPTLPAGALRNSAARHSARPRSSPFHAARSNSTKPTNESLEEAQKKAKEALSAAQKQGAKAWETAKAYSGPVQGFLQTAAKQAGPVAKRVGESLGPLVQRLGPAGQKTVQFFASACWILLGC